SSPPAPRQRIWQRWSPITDARPESHRPSLAGHRAPFLSRRIEPLFAPMRRIIVDARPDRDNPVRIYRVVAVVVMPGDMIEMHRLCHARPLIQLADIGPECGVIDNPRPVAFEMAMIDRIKAYERGEQPPIRLG